VFIGHFAVAFAAKKVAPKASLGTLVFAAVFLDAVWPVLVLLGIERFRIVAGYTAINPFEFLHYPWSHSMLMTGVWAVLFAIVYQTVKGDRAGAMWVGIVVASHWVLDCVTHRPDMPLYPGGSERLGLALWQSWPATFAVEGSMFAAAVALQEPEPFLGVGQRQPLVGAARAQRRDTGALQRGHRHREVGAVKT